MLYESASLIVTSTIFGCFAIAAVAARLWTKRRRGLPVVLDDYLIMSGLTLTLGLCVCVIIGAEDFSIGDHRIFPASGPLPDEPVPVVLPEYGKILYSIQLLHCTAMFVIKASLVVFLHRLYSINFAFRMWLYAFASYVFLWWYITFFMSVFHCWPVSSNWGAIPAEASECIPDYMSWYSWTALLNVISDALIVLLPLPILWRLRIPAQRKLATFAILVTAAAVITAGTERTVAFFTYDQEWLDSSSMFYDFLIWTVVEPCLGVVGCCLPLLAPTMDGLSLTGLYDRLRGTVKRRPSNVSEPEALLQQTSGDIEQGKNFRLEVKTRPHTPHCHLEAPQRAFSFPAGFSPVLGPPLATIEETMEGDSFEKWVYR